MISDMKTNKAGTEDGNDSEMGNQERPLEEGASEPAVQHEMREQASQRG